MKATTVLGVLLAGSIVTCFYLYTELNKKDIVIPSDCYSGDGFIEPRTISEDEARTFVSKYRETLIEPDSTLGGVITRSAFDSILCVDNCNAVTYMLGIDETGEIGPGGNGVFILFSGAKVNYDEHTGGIESIEDLGISKYIAQHWCPPTCAPH